ncbi:MAG: J domain-containing protein [Planctomycetaceae bacterium]|nr:J domain-containing protein [Planctomycetaceae bacterium]
MSDSPLPSNLADWPANLHDLFGVQEDCTERDLRRSYHRLIKYYRAEEYPAEFRKLNESYESLRARLQYEQEYRRQQEHSPEDPDDESDWFSAPETSFRKDNKREWETHGSAPQLDSRVLYQTAIDGDIKSSIEQLETFCHNDPRDEDAALRLFWLKKIDSGAPAFEVLESYLKKNGLTGRVFQVYLNELDRVPAAALRASCRELLLASAGDERLPGLSRLIWYLLSTQKNLKRIEQDLDDLKDSLVYDHPDQWKELVYQAVEFYALAGLPKSNATFQKLRQEVRECESTVAPEWIETRWEMVLSITCEAAVPGAIPDNLVKIVRDSLVNDDWELRLRLEQLVMPWTSVPTVGLAALDRLREWSPTASYLFHRTASHSRGDDYLYHDSKAVQLLQPVVLRFLRTENAKKYEDLRTAVCQFCQYEDITLDVFLRTVLECQQSEQVRFLQDDVVKLLDEDWPLKGLIAALRIFNE